MNSENKVVLVTGGGHGLGKEIARAFLAAGFRVSICGRNQSRLDECRKELETIAGPDAVCVTQADVSDQDDVRRLVSSTLEKFGQIDVLVNNAAVLGPLGSVESLDLKNWLKTIEINLCGTVLMSKEVIPHFKSRKQGRIINLSGGGATIGRPNFSAYAASKAAVVRFTETLAQELADHGITVNVVAPGALNTEMLDNTLAAGVDVVGDKAFKQCSEQKQTGGDPLEPPCQLCIFLTSDNASKITGRLISAKWDNWHALAQHADELVDTDIYTLRRITPQDRGLVW
ncbi:MAG: SDR family oxidoreductase [Cyanobacteria bacterium SZAS-4]|nr:SDR family oxidoreductase [Cyanobacteria bacterium SZAS-4]